LAAQTGVECHVSSSASNLLSKGLIGPVTVKGKGWQSPLGLSCRVIEAKVETCHIDFSSVVKRRKLILVEPAVGKALVALSEQDFGNFITHPLLQNQVPSLPTRENPSNKITFLKENVEIDTANNHILFFSECLGETWKLQLERGSNTAKITATHHTTTTAPSSTISQDEISSIENEMSTILSEFFNELVFELDGTFLSFQDMKIHDRKSSGPVVMMALEILVRKFPSPGLAF